MQEEILIPKLSIAERDRRYTKVRQKMAQQGIDILLLSGNHSRWEQMMADSRYLTCIGGFATEVFTVFPLEGEVTAFVFNRADWWKEAQSWVSDVRNGRNRWSRNAIDRLKELGFSKGTMGISGLSGLVRAPDGIVPYATVQALKETFPQAKIANATELMQEARAIKSQEEISFLERSMQIIEKTIETMKENIRPGITEKELYAAMIHSMLTNGGELPTLFFLGTGPDVAQSTFVPTNRVIQTNDRVVNEIEAKYGGYAAQAVSPLVLGRPAKEYEAIVGLSANCFNAILEKMRPGVTFGTLFDTYRETVERYGKGNYLWSHPMMHARGLGDDGPALMGDEDVERFRQIELQTGMAFILKPSVRSAQGKGRASIGDTVVVTENSARRLGKRELKLIVVE